MDKELLIFLTAVVGLLTAVAVGGLVVWREIRGVGRDVKEGRLEVDGRLDELLELTRRTAYAAGIKEGQDRPSSRD